MKQILVIEDNATAAGLYSAALAREGYAVAVATDGEAGLAAIQAAQPDLVVLDLMLPKVPGLEVLRQIRANAAMVNVPVMVTSNAYTAARLEELRRAGATRIFTKASISPREMARVVRNTLDSAEEQ